MSATTGWSLGDLDRLAATQIARYAVGCLEHEARRLLREMQLFTLPLESYGGGNEIRNHLNLAACRMLGQPPEAKPSMSLTEEERANIDSGIAEIERELAAQHSWYSEDARRAPSRAESARRGGKLKQQWVGDKRLLGDVRKFLGRG